MNHFRRSRFIKRVCRWLAPIMIAPLLVYYAPPANAADASPATGTSSESETIPAVIVLDFSNLSGYDGTVVGRSAAAVVAQAIQESDRWDVLSNSVVSSAMTSQGLTPPLDIPGMMQLGHAAEADSIIFGQVYGVTIKDNPKQAKVGLRVEMRDVASGELVNGSIETAVSGVRPGYTGDPQVLVDEALRKAAYQAVQSMTQNRLPKGTVLNTQVTGTGTREVLINIGAQSGVKEGMQFIVTRNKTQVARLKVMQVEPEQSTAIVIDSTRGAQPEDSVQAIYNLAPVSDLVAKNKNAPFAEKAPRSTKSNKGFSTALAGFLGAALLIGILAGSSKSGRLTDQTAGATSVNQGAPVPSGAAVKVTWSVPNIARIQDILEFQIYRSDTGLTTTSSTTSSSSSTTTGTSGFVPVGTSQPGVNYFYDTTATRDVTYISLPEGSTPGSSNYTTSVSTTTATSVAGITAGRSVTYQVVMIYRRNVNTSSGTTSSSGSTTTTTGQNVGGSTILQTTTTSGSTSGTTSGTSSGTTSGSGSGNSTSTQEILATTVATTGVVTPIVPPVANSPQAGATVTASNVNFDIQGSDGANQYMVEISTSPNFNTNVKQVLLPIQTASQQTSGSVNQTIDLTKLYSNYSGTLYWHAGARNSIDSPGPDPGIYKSGSGDRRWVYSGFESFIVP